MVLIQYNELYFSPFYPNGGSEANLVSVAITQNGIYGVDSTILGIKFIVLLSSIGVLGMS
jgi:hypothetical protein